MTRHAIYCALMVFALLLVPASEAQAQSALEFLCSGPMLCVDVAADEEMRPFPEPESPPEDLSITILLPTTGDNFAFNSASPGKLEIDATAIVNPPEYGGEVEWEVSDIGRTKATVTPERGQIVKITFEGLPDRNNHFGNKTIRAKVRGKSAKVTVQVFYNATATNHPGDGAGSTPNWFQYWKETRAAQGHEAFLGYIDEFKGSNDPNDIPIGRYILPRDRLYVTDLVQSSPGCTARSTATGGPNATGIDCFAEIIAHEWQHREEEQEWWAGLKGSYGWMLVYKMKDWDWDGVPHSVEQSETGCRDDWLSETEIAFKKWQDERIDTWYTCTSRPFPRVTDRELYAYEVGWSWGLGSVDRVDWSEGGKQW